MVTKTVSLDDVRRRIARLERVIARYDLVPAWDDAREAGWGPGVRARVAAHRAVLAGHVPAVRVGRAVMVSRGTFAAAIAAGALRPPKRAAPDGKR